MLSKLISRQNFALVNQQMRMISTKGQLRTKNEDVELRGTFIQGRGSDLPTLIWFSDLVEPASSFVPFFSKPDNKILDVRNVWCLNYRNMGDSDHHESFSMDDISGDITRFMDKQNLTMATLGGHGYGAKVALAAAIDNMDRCTGVINLEGGPLDHTYYEAYHELQQYVAAAASLDIDNMDYAGAVRQIKTHISCQRWAKAFMANLEDKSGSAAWKLNIHGLNQNMSMKQPDVSSWHQHYGLWPGQALALFAAHSRWVHLATNTLPFYNVMPRLQGQFPGHINTFGSDESPLNHWLHEGDEEEVWRLSQTMWRWLRNHDGTHVLLADKSEAGWYNIPDRGFDVEQNTRQGEYNPEHVHHNYLHSDAYERSRQARGADGATSGQFLPKGQFNDENRW